MEEIKAAGSKQGENEEGPALQPGEEPRSLACNECGKKFRSQAQAEFHASKSGHVDFSESTEEIAPLTEEEKKARLEELRQRLAAKRAVQTEQDKLDQKRNEVRAFCQPRSTSPTDSFGTGNPTEEHQRIARHQGRAAEKTDDEGSGQEEARETGGT